MPKLMESQVTKEVEVKETSLSLMSEDGTITNYSGQTDENMQTINVKTEDKEEEVVTPINNEKEEETKNEGSFAVLISIGEISTFLWEKNKEIKKFFTKSSAKKEAAIYLQENIEDTIEPNTNVEIYIVKVEEVLRAKQKWTI